MEDINIKYSLVYDTEIKEVYSFSIKVDLNVAKEFSGKPFALKGLVQENILEPYHSNTCNRLKLIRNEKGLVERIDIYNLVHKEHIKILQNN